MTKIKGEMLIGTSEDAVFPILLNPEWIEEQLAKFPEPPELTPMEKFIKEIRYRGTPCYKCEFDDCICCYEREL